MTSGVKTEGTIYLLDDEEKTAAMVVEAPECGMSYTIEFVQQKGSVKL